MQRGERFSREQPIPVPQCPYTAPNVCETDKAFGLTANVLSILGLMMLTLIQL